MCVCLFLFLFFVVLLLFCFVFLFFVVSIIATRKQKKNMVAMETLVVRLFGCVQVQ